MSRIVSSHLFGQLNTAAGPLALLIGRQRLRQSAKTRMRIALKSMLCGSIPCHQRLQAKAHFCDPCPNAGPLPVLSSKTVVHLQSVSIKDIIYGLHKPHLRSKTEIRTCSWRRAEAKSEKAVACYGRAFRGAVAADLTRWRGYVVGHSQKQSNRICNRVK